MSDYNAALEQAADWLLLQTEQGLPPEFSAWLREHPRNAKAWAEVSDTWQQLDLLQSLPEPSAEVVPLVPRARRSGAWAGLAAAAVVAVSVMPWLWSQLQADYRTGHSVMQDITLADGSRVTLAPKSALSVAFSADTRRVTLLEGEAFFDVAHAVDRPFVVVAGSAEARVLGTAFNMRIGESGTEIALKEGSLAVAGAEAGPLVPGERLLVSADRSTDFRGPIAVEDIGGWQRGEVFVEDQPLAEVLAQIAVWHPSWLSLIDSDLGARRVTGVYRLDQPQTALAALLGPVGGVARQIGPWNIVITGADQSETAPK